MTPEQARAAEAIAHTQAVYATEGDRGRLDDLVAAFTPDGVLQFHGGTHRGHEAIKAALSGGVARAQSDSTRAFVRHHLTTRRIEFDGPDAADAWTYFLVTSPLGLDHCGRYVDRFVRRGNRWLIARRRVTLDWAAPGSRQLTNVDK